MRTATPEDAYLPREGGRPVELLGFDHLPPADELVRVVGHERQAKHLANLRAERPRRERLA